MDDHRTLAQLARRRGLDVEVLATDLVQPMAATTTPEQLAILRERTVRVLTQGHLAQHLFFHVYHGIDLRTDAQSTFGLSSDSYYAICARPGARRTRPRPSAGTPTLTCSTPCRPRS